MNLQEFKIRLNHILDSNGFEGTPAVFQEVGKCAFSYNKSTLADLRNDGTQHLATLAPANFVVRLRIFIETIATYDYLPEKVQEGNEIIMALKKIPIQWDNEILEKYNSNIKIFLVFSEKFYEKGINWFWANHLLSGKEIDCYLKAQSNDIIQIKNLLSEIFQDNQIMEYNRDELLNAKTIDGLSQNLIARLKSKNLCFVIDECIGLLKKEEDEINFFSDIWLPICKIIESENVTNHLEFFFVHSGSELKTKHIYTEDIASSISLRKPFIIKYNGFTNKKEPDVEKSILKIWIEEENKSDKGVIAQKITVGGKKFQNLFEDNEKEYSSACECGNIEKLFEKISKDFGYRLNTSKTTDDGKIIWELIEESNQVKQEPIDSI